MTANNDRAVRNKKANFDALYALDNEEDDEIDEGLLASFRKIQGRTLGDPTVPPSGESRRTTGRTLGGLSRSYSSIDTPFLSGQQLRSKRNKNPRQLLDEIDTSSSTIKDTPVLRRHHTVVGTASLGGPVSEGTMPFFSAPPSSSAIPLIKNKKGKGRQEADIKVLPEDQQLFRDLHFYFFPNNDTHPGRAQRIVKALEYGATWQKDLIDCVTHIITDHTYDFEQFLKYLKLSELPTGVVLVNEKYPASCLEFHRLLDPSSVEFRVKGYTGPAPSSGPQATTNRSQESEVSLKLKPIRKSAAIQSSQTNSHSETSSGLSSPAATPVQPIQPNEIGTSPVPEEDVDELNAAIREAKEYHPLASDDDENKASESRKRRKLNNWQDRFQCMHKHTGDNDKGPNTQTISVLQELANHYEQTRDQWRCRSYRQAISALRKQTTKINTKEEALRVHNIGTSIAEKIEEIVRTNHLRKLDYTKLDERQQILTKFMKIYGVGMVVAERWASAGYKTLDDLQQKADLTDNQRIGIAHYDDFNTRIPRAEVERHASIVKSALAGFDKAYQVHTMGSYRRGAADSGDIDLLITKPGVPLQEIREMVMDRLVPLLTRRKFLVAALAQTSQADGTKWHGASCLPQSRIWRRIDLLLVPEEELGAALLYFTGNDIFNRSLRLLASRKGMRLNQRGLYKEVLRGYQREKLTEGVLVEGKDERKIFKALGVPWRPPEHRIC